MLGLSWAVLTPESCCKLTDGLMDTAQLPGMSPRPDGCHLTEACTGPGQWMGDGRQEPEASPAAEPCRAQSQPSNILAFQRY